LKKSPSTERLRHHNPHENQERQYFQQQGNGAGIPCVTSPPRLLSPKNREFGGKCCKFGEKFGENYAAWSKVSFRSFCSLATCVLNSVHGKMVEKASDTVQKSEEFPRQRWTWGFRPARSKIAI